MSKNSNKIKIGKAREGGRGVIIVRLKQPAAG